MAWNLRLIDIDGMSSGTYDLIHQQFSQKLLLWRMAVNPAHMGVSANSDTILNHIYVAVRANYHVQHTDV